MGLCPEVGCSWTLADARLLLVGAGQRPRPESRHPDVARRQRLSTRRVTVLCGLAVLSVAGLGWAHRQDLKRWLRWWEIRRLEALRERDPGAQAFQPTENLGLSPFEVAFSRHVKLQRPEFRGAQDLSFFPLRGRHGRTVLAAVYEPMLNDFETPVDEDTPLVVSFCCCNCKTVEILLFDGFGNLLHEPARESWDKVKVQHAEPIRIVSRGTYDVLQFRSRHRCRGCDSLLLNFPWQEFSVDSTGLVGHGLVATDVPGAPVCAPPARGAKRLSSLELGELLGSGGAADAHRVLTDIEHGDPEDAMLVEPLLGHEEALVRARAAVIASRVPGLRDRVLSLIDDPDPGVRAAVIIAARNFPGWEAAILPLTRSSDAALARRARLELSHSEDPEYARPALLGLVRDREGAALHRDHGLLADGELADAMLDWLEASESALRDIAPHLNAYSREILIDRIDRLLSLYRRAAAEGQEGTLIDVLVKVDDPRADEVLMESLGGTLNGVHVSKIVRALLVRGTPIRTAAAGDVLVKLLREDRCHDLCKDNITLLLMRHERIEALRWVLMDQEGEFFPMSQILGWISAASVDYEKPEPEVVLYPPILHTN